MLSRTLDSLKKLKSYLFLEDRATTYKKRAEYCRQHAVIESLKKYMFPNNQKSFPLIDVGNITALTLLTKSKAQFARDENGVYFARIEGNKYYYPIDTKHSQHLLEKSEKYEKLSKSFLERLLEEPFERLLGRDMFEMSASVIEISDETFQLQIMVEEIRQNLEEQGRLLNNLMTILYTTIRTNDD